MDEQRLVHVHSAYLRRMQMSQTELFVLVEGKEVDPFFYGALCSAVCPEKGVKWTVVRADEVAEGAGGKTALLQFYRYLLGREKLVSLFEGKRTVVVFFLDKDIDDLLGRIENSPHLIYTRYYDVYNEAFLNGDLYRGTAAAACVDESQIAIHLGNPMQWRRNAAMRWFDWTVLCVLAATQRINCQSNYRICSQVQCPREGTVDTERLSSAKAVVAARLGLKSEEFERLYEVMRAQTAEYFESGQHDIVFKGKWYPQLLDEDLRRLLRRKGYMQDGFPKRVAASILATLTFSDSWSDYYRSRLGALIETSRIVAVSDRES